jgi:hypothetical protein
MTELIEHDFDDTLSSCAPSRIRTCAHGSGGRDLNGKAMAGDLRRWLTGEMGLPCRSGSAPLQWAALSEDLKFSDVRCEPI